MKPSLVTGMTKPVDGINNIPQAAYVRPLADFMQPSQTFQPGSLKLQF
jgi:hypothetical protein